jgi:glycosyltransferase involved in cell wall biosynthesis
MLDAEPSLELILYSGFKAPGVWDPTTRLDRNRVTVRWNLLPDRLKNLLPSLMDPPIAARSQGLDVLLGLDHVLLPVRGCPGCVVIHDLSYHRYPEHVDPAVLAHVRNHVPDSVRRAALIVTPSSFTRSEVIDVFGVAEDRVVHIPWGVSAAFKPVTDAGRLEEFLKRHGLTSGYVLAVGSLQPRKNLRHLLRVFLRWREEHGGGPKLVLTGGIAWRAGDLIPELEAHHEAVVRLGHVAEDDLPTLYSAAAVLVFPSLYEGFGFPILEAMACGTPVIASDRTSCPEVGGDAAWYVDPEDDEALFDALTSVLGNESIRTDLRERGLKRATAFTWTRTAQHFLEALRHVR